MRFEASGKIVNDLTVDTQTPEERLIYGLNDKMNKKNTSVGNVQAILPKTGKCRTPLTFGISNGLGTYIPSDPSQFTGFIALQSVNFLGYLKESVLASTFQMNLSVDWFAGFQGGEVVPAIDLKMPCYFNITAWNSNYAYDYPTGLSPFKKYSVYLSVYVGNLIFKASNQTFRFTSFNKNYDLLNTITYRPYTEANGNDLTLNPTQIDVAQLNNILDNGQTFLFGTFVDLSALSVPNQTIMQNLSTVISFDSEITFLYNGIQLAKI